MHGSSITKTTKEQQRRKTIRSLVPKKTMDDDPQRDEIQGKTQENHDDDEEDEDESLEALDKNCPCCVAVLRHGGFKDLLP